MPRSAPISLVLIHGTHIGKSFYLRSVYFDQKAKGLIAEYIDPDGKLIREFSTIGKNHLAIFSLGNSIPRT